MKVGLNVNKVVNTYNNSKKPGNIASEKKTSGDKIEISRVGKDFSKYLDAASKVDIKSSNYDEVSKKYKAGDYKVDSTALAKSIVNTMNGSEI